MGNNRRFPQEKNIDIDIDVNIDTDIDIDVNIDTDIEIDVAPVTAARFSRGLNGI